MVVGEVWSEAEAAEPPSAGAGAVAASSVCGVTLAGAVVGESGAGVDASGVEALSPVVVVGSGFVASALSPETAGDGGEAGTGV